MSLVNRRSCLAPLPVLLALCSLFCLRAPIAAQTAAPAPPHNAAAAQPRFLQLDHLSPDQLDPADAALLRSQHRAISTEAAFFGYDLHASGWTWNEAACPAFPSDRLLHYQRTSRDGAVSLFTALVPLQSSAHHPSGSGQDRVYVVPILYRNATPFQSADGSARSIAVFNRVVPADLAVTALQPDGRWLLLGLCYADLVGAEAHALQQSGADVALALAPLPTLHITEDKQTRQVVFTDRDAPGRYLVRTLSFASDGRLLAATATRLSDYIAPLRNGKEPPVRPMPAGKEPPVKVLPPAQEPNVKPLPQ